MLHTERPQGEVALNKTPLPRRLFSWLAFEGQPIRMALFVLAGIPLLVLMASLAYETYKDYRHDTATAYQTASTIRATSTARTEQFLASAKATLSDLSRHPRVRALDPLDCDPELAGIKQRQPAYANLLTLDAKGQLVCSAADVAPGRAAGPDPKYFFNDVVRTRQFTVGKPARGFITGRWVSTLAYPILDDAGQLTGVVAIAVDLVNYQPVVELEGAPADTEVGIIDSEGTLIAHSNDAATRIGTVSEAVSSKIMLAQVRGTLRSRDYQGVNRFYAFAPIAGSDWTTFVSLDEAAVLAPVTRLMYQRLAWMIALIAVVATMAHLVARSIARPIEAISKSIASADGRVMRRAAPAGPTELRQIADQLNASLALRLQAEADLRRSEERYRGLIEWTPLAIAVHDGKTILYVNPAAIEMFGATSAQDLVGTQILALTPPDVRESAAQRLRSDLEQGGKSKPHVTKCLKLDGTTIYVEMQGVPIVFDGVHARQIAMRDITELKAAQEAQRVAATAFESRQGMVIANAKQVILQVNKAFTDITGYSAQEAVGQTPRLLSSGHHDAAFYAAMWECIAKTGTWQGEIWNRRKSGEVFPEWLSISSVKDEAGLVTHYVAAFNDITTHKTAQDQIRHLAFTDPLTALPNRRRLTDRLQQALAATAHHQRQGALLLVDLDDFKTLNDTLGHDQGDSLLQEVARRLESCIRDGDLVARFGGDEFVVLLERLARDPGAAATEAEVIGETIIRTLNQPYQLGSAAHHSTASIGVTLFGDERESAVEYLKRAELAMYQAKAAGRNTLRFFDPQMQAVVSARLALESGLREAIRHKQFVLLYQPQVTSEGSIVGVEALVRWLDPRRGMVSPAEFIPPAEDSGLILLIGHWVLETACNQLALWAKQTETAGLSISVNVSARQFHQEDFVDQVFELLDRTGANANRLKLELTESVLITNIEGVIARMNALKGRGVGFSIDDFGTGYSSLSYLKRLPLDQLKIDQGFVRDILIDTNDAAIARMVVALADSVGLTVVAEGVETEAQRDFLAALGCLNYQGYLFSRPLPIDQLEELVRQGKRHAA